MDQKTIERILSNMGVRNSSENRAVIAYWAAQQRMTEASFRDYKAKDFASLKDATPGLSGNPTGPVGPAGPAASGGSMPGTNSSGRFVSFAQQSRDGHWLRYDFRDDLNERQGYWALDTAGNVSYVSPIQSGGDDRFDQDVNRGSTNSTRDKILNPFIGFMDRITGDPLVGREQGGEVGLTPEWTKGFREYLATYNIDPRQVDARNAADLAEMARAAATGTPKGSNFDREFFAQWGERNPSANPESFLRLYVPKYQNKAVDLIDPYGTGKGADASGVPYSPASMAAGFRSGDLDKAQGDPKTTSTAGTQTTGTGRSGGSSFASSASGGSSLTPGRGTVPVPNESGQLGGYEVTPDLLSDYLNDNWQATFHAFVKSFRDAGAAGHFVSWMEDQMWTYYNQFQGELATQALEGQVPRGDFQSFLSRRNVNGVGDIGGDQDFTLPGFDGSPDPAITSVPARLSSATAASAQDTVSPSAGDLPGVGRNSFIDYVSG